MDLREFALHDCSAHGQEKGAKIPWDDLDFSRRMLHNHLAQEHDWASRRNALIVQQARWIAKQLQKTSVVLDLGCGPGLYTQELAALGHRCTGVDFSPASIEYAQAQAADKGLALDYILCDIRTFTTGKTFDCIVMTFGEFNVFTRQDATAILKNCAAMLCDTGLLVLEVHTFDAVRAVGQGPATWQRHASGLFSDKPHLCLQENSWNAKDSSALSRYFIVDAATAAVQQYASFMQAYTPEEYRGMLHTANLSDVVVGDAATWPAGDDFQGKLQPIVARKKR